MRRCLLDDLVAGAARLAIEPLAMRPALADRIITEAHAAHHYMRRMNRPHPRWGNGSLMARALAEAAPQSPLCLTSLAIIAAAVARFRARNRAIGRGLFAPSDLCYDLPQPQGRDTNGGNQGKTYHA